MYALHQLLSRAAARNPEHQAVRCTGASLTYAELDAAANGLARHLVRAGIERGDRVGIFLPKRLEMVAAVYGALKAGAAYVPLDPKAPTTRAATVAGDCSIAALVTTTERARGLLPMLGPSVRLVVLVDDGAEAGAALPVPTLAYGEATGDPLASDPGIPVIDEDLAYILYTSGSTGVPKGVMLSHRNALAFVEWSASTIGISAEDRVSNHAPLHFDLSVFDLFLSSLGGATLCLVPEHEASFPSSLARFIRDERITLWYSVPSALMQLIKARPEPGAFPTLRAVVFAGEVFPTKQLRQLRALMLGPVFWNLYGPTETNVCTYYRVADLPEDDRTIPIGRACDNSEVFALRENGEEAGIGEEGELYVRGATVMKGYWGRSERTAAVLVRNPLTPHLPDLVYRTGDVVRLRPDGDYDFLGRRDHQIKSRGYRIELGEIESVLNAHAMLAEAVAVAVPHEEWGNAIVAHVVPVDGASVTELEIKRHVAGRLPRYMVPWKVEIRVVLPRTPNGKIDRQKVLQEATVSTGS